MRIFFTGLPLLVLAVMAGATAQTPAAPNSRAAAPSAPMIQIAPEKTIPLDQAIAAVQTALATCAAKNSPATVEVVDLNGNIKALISADSARANSFEAARKKAYTVLKKGISSGDFARSLGSPPVNTVVEGDPDLRASGGALPIMRSGALIGALAVSGPTGQADDEACALAGVAKFHF